MEKLKLVLTIVFISVAVVGLMVFGLSRMGGAASKVVDVEQLINGARWVAENGETKVTVVEFSDLQCPGCSLAEKLAKELRGMDGVRFVYRQFPLTNIHGNSMSASMAIEAAREMNQGWEMLEKLFETQEIWAVKTPDEMTQYIGDVGERLGLDRKELIGKLSDSRYKQWIEKDVALANNLALPGTPTFLVDGERVEVNQLMEVVKSKLGK